MRAHEAFWVYLAERGSASVKKHVERRTAEGPAKDARWLIGRTGLKAREAWLALPEVERAAYMSATPDANFPLGNNTGILDDRKNRAAAISVNRFVAAVAATRHKPPPASSTAASGFTADESAWIREQMEPFRRVPLETSQWRRLLQAFVRRFPGRGIQPTLREYKLQVVRIEEERTAKELHAIDAKYPARPTTRNISHEFKVQTKRVDAMAVIKQEQRERRRTPVSVFENDERSEDELEELEELEEVRSEGGGGEDSTEEEEEEEEEEVPSPTNVVGRTTTGGAMRPHRTRPTFAIVRSLKGDLEKSEEDAAQWKAKFEAANTTAEKLKKQLTQAKKALRNAKQRLKEQQASAKTLLRRRPPPAPPTPASVAASASATANAATSIPDELATSQTAPGLTFVINVHLDRGTMTLGGSS